MAKKIQNKLDDYGFDSGFDNFDFDFDPPSMKDDRSPVTKVSTGFIKGVKETLKDTSFIRSMVKNIFPKGYGETLDTLVDTKNEIQGLYNSVSEEINETIKSSKKVLNKALPFGSQYLPGSVTKSLEKFTSSLEEESNAYTYTDPVDNEISQNLAEIFKIQASADDRKDRQRDVKEQLRESLAFNRHKESISQFNHMRVSLGQLVTYQNKITSAYQKKSLELQYRQFFVARDALVEQKRQGALFSSYLESINKNTALPDYVKLRDTERIGEAVRNKFINNAMEGLIGNRTEFVRQVASRFGERIKSNVGQTLSGVRSGLAQGEMMFEQFTGMENMVDPLSMGSELAGNLAPYGLLGSRVGRSARKKLEAKFPQLVKGGNELSFLGNNVQQLATKWAKSGQGDFSLLSFLLDPLKSAILQNGPNRHIEIDNIKNLQEPGIYTRQANKSITEVIPGLLSRIHHELAIIRTGDSSIEAIGYDFTKSKFDVQSKIKGNIFKSVINKSQKESFKRNMDGLIDEIDPDKKLSRKARSALAQQLLRDNMNNETSSPNRLRDRSSYKGEAARYSKQYSEVFGDYFDNDPNSERKVSFSNRYNDIGRNISLNKEQVQNIVNSGLGGVLEEAGILTLDSRDPYSASGLINFDRVAGHISGSERRYNPRGNIGKAGAKTSFNGSMRSVSSNYGGYSSSDEMDSNSSLNITQAIADHSPLELLSIVSSTLSNIDNKLSTGVTTLNVGQINTEQHKKIVDEQEKSQKSRFSDIHERFKKSRVGAFTRGISTSLSVFSGIGGVAANIAKNVSLSIAKGAGNLFRTTSGLLGEGADSVIGRGKDLTDIFIAGKDSPVLESWKLRTGQYKDELTGKVIKSFKDIKGNVVDENGKVALTKEDLSKAYTRTKSGAIKSLSTLGAKIGDTGFVKSVMQRFSSMDLKNTGLFGVTRSFNLQKTKSIYDIYVKGKTEPILQNWKLKAGKYKDSVTNKTITDFRNIVNDIIDLETGEVIKVSDLKQAFTKTVQGIKPFEIIDKGFKHANSILGRVAHGVGDLVSTGMGRARDTGKWFFANPNTGHTDEDGPEGKTTSGSPFDKTLDGLGAIGKLGMKAGSSAVNFLGSVAGEGLGGFFKVFGAVLEPIFRGRTIVKRLTQIRDMLDERLAGKKIRKGSYEDQMSNKDDDDSEGDGGGINDKIGSMSDSWNSSIFGMGAGALSKLFKRKKGEDGEGGGGGGLMETILGGYLGSKLGGKAGLGKLLGTGAKYAARAGGTALAGMGLYNMLSEGDFSAGNIAQTAGGALMTNTGRSLAMGAGRLALTGAAAGGGALLGGVGTVMGGIGTGLAALVGTVGLPILIGGAALAAGGYYTYKYFTNKDPETLSTVRFIQYGFNPKDIDKFRQLMQLDGLMQECVIYTGEETARIDQQKFIDKISDIFKIFDINKEDGNSIQKLVHWIDNRYRHIFIKSMLELRKIKKEIDLVDIDSKLKDNEKLSFLNEVSKIEPEVYDINVSPYYNERTLVSGRDEVNIAIKVARAKLIKLVGDNKPKDAIGKVAAMAAASTTSTMLTQASDEQSKASAKSDVPTGQTSMDNPDVFATNFTKALPTALVGGMAEKLDSHGLDISTRVDIGVLNKIKLIYYGIDYLNKNHVRAITVLDKIALQYVKGVVSSISLKITYKEHIATIFDSFGIDPENKEQVFNFNKWFNDRYVPVFMSYMLFFNDASNRKALVDLDNLLDSPDKAWTLVSFSVKDTVFKQITSPFPNGYALVSSREEINLLIEEGREVYKKFISDADERYKNQSFSRGVRSKYDRIADKDRNFNKDNRSSVAPIPDDASNNRSASPNTIGGNVSGSVVASSSLQGSSASETSYGGASTSSSSSGSSAGSSGGPRLLEGNAKANRAVLIRMAKKEGITDPVELAMLVAQADVETGGFRKFNENLNYSASRLKAVWPGRFREPGKAERVAAAGPEAIANAVYGDRMGNQFNPGDGWKYRGRGFIQLTGRNNYEAAAKDTGMDFVNNPDLVLTPEGAAMATISWWRRNKYASKYARLGDVRNTSAAVNAGDINVPDSSINHLAQRKAIFNKYISMVKDGSFDSLANEEGDVYASASTTASSGPVSMGETSEIGKASSGGASIGGGVAAQLNPALTSNSDLGQSSYGGSTGSSGGSYGKYSGTASYTGNLSATELSKMQTIRLIREPSTDSGTFGKFIFPDGTKFESLELPWRENMRQKSCIPPGKYVVAIKNSPKFGRVYEVKGVPGRSAILIHAGNSAGNKDKGQKSDVLGCILLGLGRRKTETQEFVTESKKAIAAFMAKMGGNPFLIEISGGQASPDSQNSTFGNAIADQPTEGDFLDTDSKAEIGAYAENSTSGSDTQLSGSSTTYNPMATGYDISTQQQTNSQTMHTNIAPLVDSMGQSVAVSKQILDVNTRQLEAIVDLARTMKGLSGLAQSQPTEPAIENPEKPSNTNPNISNSPIKLNKKYAA